MGRRTRTLFSLFALLATTFAIHPAHAIKTIDVELYGSPPTISPNPIIAQAGDVIRFSVINGGNFQLKDYAQTFGSNTLIDSQQQLDGSKGQTSYEIQFGGGTVRYRDLLGTSRLDPNTGVCTGLCGVLTDETTTPLPPVIDQPTRTIQEDPATITGTAEPMTIVTLDQGTSVAYGRYQGQALTGPDGTWKVKTVDFGRGDAAFAGTKNLIARAVRAVGYVSDDSAVVQYNYVPDITPPSILTFDPVVSPVFTGKIQLSGTVQDNIGIAGLALQFTSIQPNVSTVNPANSQIQQIFQLGATQCGLLTPQRADCPIIAHDQLLTWSFDSSKLPATTKIPTLLNGLPLGVYSVTAIATDTSGNQLHVDLQVPETGNEIIFTNANPSAVTTSLPKPVQSEIPSPQASPVVPVLPTDSVPPTP
ncbi:MAG: hypothetical protein ACYDCC_12800 [Actinomycetota bacterium]